LTKNILITGSSGYIGSHIVNKSKKLFNFNKFSLQTHTLQTINFNNIDTVLHCAAIVHKKNKLNFAKYYKINTKYPVELAKRAKQNGVNHFVFLSTIAIYDDSLEMIVEKSKINPTTFYGKSKLEAERQLLELCDNNFLISIIRIPMVYGKGAPGNITTLIQMVKYLPIIPLGNIKNKRSFIYIENLSNLVNKIIINKTKGIFLGCDDKAISTSQFVELIARCLNKFCIVFKIPLLEPVLKTILPSFHRKLFMSLVIDNQKTKLKLSLTNPYSVEDGIKEMMS